MEDIIIKYLINEIAHDKDLKTFYDTYYCNKFSHETLDDYMIDLITSNSDMFTKDLSEYKKLILKRIRDFKYRLNKKGEFEGRLINYPDASTLRESTIKSILNNEISLFAIDALINYYDIYSKITERPLSLDGMYTAKEKTTLFDTGDSFDVGNYKAYKSDELYSRAQGMIQPLYIQTDTNIETVIVNKGEKAYLKSKSLDAKDQKAMDYFIEDYKRVMYYIDNELIYPLYKLSELIYNNRSDKYLDLTQNRLTKMSCHGFMVYNDEPSEETSLTQDVERNYAIANMFEIRFFTNEQGVRHCGISISRSIDRDLRLSNTIKLYKHKIDQITNDFTAIFVNFLQSQRISSLLKGQNEISIPYKILKLSIMLPHSRSKPKNMIAIEESLDELKNMNFIIDDYNVTSNYIKLSFIEFSYIELKELKLEDKMKELEV